MKPKSMTWASAILTTQLGELNLGNWRHNLRCHCAGGLEGDHRRKRHEARHDEKAEPHRVHRQCSAHDRQEEEEVLEIEEARADDDNHRDAERNLARLPFVLHQVK